MMGRRTWINYMLESSRQNSTRTGIFNELLEPLPLKELKILRKNPDLLERVWAICTYTKHGLREHIRDCHAFGIVEGAAGDVWVESKIPDALIPGWISTDLEDGKVKLPFAGWYLTFSRKDNAFEPWARSLLLQEVRTNLWMRYMEHKLETASGRKNPFDDDIGYGLYL